MLRMLAGGFTAFFSLISFVTLTGTAEVETRDHSYASRMIFHRPASHWNEAMPIGNGRLGAMIYHGVQEEHLSLNEETLWSGAPREWNNAEGTKYLPPVRQAALAGEYRRADSLSRFMQGPYTESYLPLADLRIRYEGMVDSSDYSRELNLDSGISKLVYRNKGEQHRRIAFSSFPDQVIVLNHSATGKKNLSFSVSLTSKLRYTTTMVSPTHLVISGLCPTHVEPAYLWKIKNDEAIQYGNPENSMRFQVHVVLRLNGGASFISGNELKVQGADEVSFIISAATSYNGFKNHPGSMGKDESAAATQYLKKVSKKSYATLLKNHVADYQPIYRRLYLNLGRSTQETLPVDERLKNMMKYTDPELVAMIVQYGRYLLIASSRPGGQPANLKGIWNDRVRPEYSSNWCLDHDAQMFYYAVETANISEMHLPFLNYIRDLSENGKITARVNYGMPGWCAHHNSDIWRSTGASGNWGEGNPHWATWNMAGPWLSSHLYEHFLFTGDRKFLLEEAWPVMKEAARFCLNWLVTDAQGYLISVPSVSPENTFITEKGDTAQISVNTTADIALTKSIFTNCILAADLLKIDHDFRDSLKNALVRIQPYPIGPGGELLEWQNPWRAMDPSHRHLSHMYPLFPGDEISPANTAELAQAARKALPLREKTNCSWGFAWKAACWARLGEGDSAWNEWKWQLNWVDPLSRSSINNYGLFPNFFNSDGADVIMNGNGGATAVMMEMLVQSHTGVIDFLPALPQQFAMGEVSGIRARNGFELSVSWKENKLASAVIASLQGNICRIRCSKPVQIYQGGKELLNLRNVSGVIEFPTKKGEKYQLIVSGT